MKACAFLAPALLPGALWIGFTIFAAPLPQELIPQTQILNRVAEEAEIFELNLPNCFSQETLEQRALMPPSRFRPLGQGSAAPAPWLRVRRIVSEYSVASFKESDSRDLHEFRQVVSVDGKEVRSAASARHALSLGIQAQDDRLRKRMLEDFARHGLVDIATDYALILLNFGKRAQTGLEIGQAHAAANIGTDAVLVLGWKQKSQAGGEIEFSGRRTFRQSLEGNLWVRQSDGLPLRIEAWAEYQDRKERVRDEATIEYVRSPHGFLMPVSVVHRHLADGRLITENRYQYQPFRKFSSDAEIKFTEVPDPAPATPEKTGK